MKKIFIISAVLLLLAGCGVKKVDKFDELEDAEGVKEKISNDEFLISNEENKKREEDGREEIGEKEEIKRAEKEGITVDVKKVSEETFMEAYKLEMDNHRYNLEELLIGEKSTLNNMLPKDYKILSSNMGGHHIISLISFEKINGKEKQLKIFLRDDLIFDFKINE